jgi:hypothetical protein
MEVMSVLPSKSAATIRGVVSSTGSSGFALESSPSRFIDLGNCDELASPDSVVPANRDQFDLVAFRQFRAPVFVAPM